MPYPKTQAVLDELLSKAVEKYGDFAVEFLIERAMTGGTSTVEPTVSKNEKPVEATASLDDLVDKTRGRE